MPLPNVRISPNFDLNSFQGCPSLDEKITIFEDRINGWFLDVVSRVIVLDGQEDGFRPTDFAILAILAVYFEMIAQYHSGRGSRGASRAQFCEGIKLVFPRRYNDHQKNAIYTSVRCALYHNGLTRGAVVGRERQEAFPFEDGLVWINPTSLLVGIRQHFTDFIANLRNPASAVARQRFETIYDANPKL
jgi:hypothetical protein